MLDTNTKRKIDNARDILVGKIPDPKSQVEQITIAMIYKFMDDMDIESVDMGGKAKFFAGEYSKYSWRNIMSPKLGGHDRLAVYAEGIEKMNQNPNIPQLFRDIFKGAFLPYRDPETLNLFLKEINEFSYEHSERLGDAFEYLLSVLGSQGDAGQFRTPRHIIDFVAQVVNPQKNETILDPACGTAGFLISAYKHILNSNPKISITDKNKLMKNFVGYDISHDMVRLSRVNMFLHQFPDPHIHEYDTLTSEERWDETYDVILANPPFMTPKGGIRPHNRFSIQANRSEVLFVDYIAEHLSGNGRAGVIVPEGIIFQSGNAYKDLRKMLIEKHLYAVVSLPAGVFNPYSGVKTSILLMDKQLAKKADNILFVKIENDGYGLGAQRREIDKNDLPDAAKVIADYIHAVHSGTVESFQSTDKPCGALLVRKAKLAENGDYNLTGDRYRTTEHKKHHQWPIVKLGDVCEVISGQSPEGEFYNDNGKGTPFYQGKTEFTEKYIGSPTKWTTKETKIAEKDDILMSVRAPVGPVNIATQRICIGRGLAAIRTTEKVLMPFMFTVLKNKEIKGNSGSTFDSINRKDIEAIQIPLPPLEVQREIVAEIEGYQRIIDGARQVVDSWKPQIEIDPDWEMVKLGDVSKLMTGGTPLTSKKEYYGGDIKWLVSGDINKGEIFDCEGRITDIALKESNARLLPINSVLIALNGQGKTRGTVAILRTEAACNQSLVSINPDSKKLMPEFLLYVLKGKYQDIRNINGDNQRAGLNMPIIRSIEIPLPPLEVQREIVAAIETERRVVDSCRELIATYEAKIKKVIDKVWEG